MFLRENEAYLDHWLMQMFPGRTLEELDRIDWLRLMRAQDAGRLVSNEQRRELWMDEKLQDNQLTPAEMRHIRKYAYLDEEDG